MFKTMCSFIESAHLCLTMVIVAASVLMCSSRQEERPPLFRPEMTEGWVDDDTFRVRGSADTLHNAPGRDDGGKSACEAAHAAAQYRILALFRGMGTRGIDASAVIKRTPFYDQWIISGTIVTGTVISKEYDSATGKCMVVLEIHEKGLKGIWEKRK